MNDAEYTTLAEVEQSHWWFLAFRELLSRCLKDVRFALPPNPSILDAGCGTGANLKFLQALLEPEYLGGFDISPLAVTWSQKKCPAADVYCGDIRYPELHRDQFDLILSCDVIYVPGIAESMDGLRTLVAHLATKGLLMMNVPAYQWLYSDHDRAVHTRERYVLSQIRGLFKDLGLSCELASYRLCGLFPLLLLRRIPSICGLHSKHTASSELKLGNPILNRLLYRILQFENVAISKNVRFPFGSSIFVVGRKIS